jgi:hypothetical protein
MEETMDMETMNENITSQINLIKNPVTETLSTPWNTVNEIEVTEPVVEEGEEELYIQE